MLQTGQNNNYIKTSTTVHNNNTQKQCIKVSSFKKKTEFKKGVRNSGKRNNVEKRGEDHGEELRENEK